MLGSCRYVCAAWAAIGLVTLAAGLAAGRSDLLRVGALAVVAFGALGVALASDDFASIARRFAPHGAGSPPGGAPRALWQRPVPYVLLPATGFVVLVGRMLLRPPLGADARYLAVGLIVGALVLAVASLLLLIADSAGSGGRSRSRP